MPKVAVSKDKRGKGRGRGLPAGRAGKRDLQKLRVKKELQEIQDIDGKLTELADDNGVNTCDDNVPSNKKFSSFPLSQRTLQGLTEKGFAVPTAIQYASLIPALKGRDILGAARTGSGKTLAFLIPILESLWKLKWSKMDGIGAVVISPTRELALQTFQCLADIGSKHDMSAGLIIGGTTFEREQANIPYTNILICTPGRLLQHLDETPNFDCMNLRVLVLDEADRMMDLGFSKAMDAIVQSMPPDRQTLLFSATMSNDINRLARLSLSQPISINTNPPEDTATPAQLMQAYIPCPLEKKLDILYSFVKSHLTNKTLVFVSSCKQVRYIYETFRRFRPGVPLMELHGKQKQMKRVAIFSDFTKKKAAVLFATDIAARGLDFPEVDWVYQMDCPESADTYIHRVGRTARYNKEGKALITLLPSELIFLERLKERKIVLQETSVASDVVKPVTPLLRSLCASDTDLKYLAQKSFISYMRSVFLQSDKEVFQIDEIPIDAFATALGLPNTPKIKFSKKKKKVITPKADKEFNDADFNLADPEAEGDVATSSASAPAEMGVGAKKAKSKFEALRTRQNQDVLSKHRMGLVDTAGAGLQASEPNASDDDDDDIFVASETQRHKDISTEDTAAQNDDEVLPERRMSRKERKLLETSTKASLAKFTAGGKKGPSTHLRFEEDGTAVDEINRVVGFDHAAALKDSKDAKIPSNIGKHDISEAAAMLQREDVTDKQVQKDKLRAKRQKKRLRHKEALMEAAGGGGVTLGGSLSDSDHDYSGDDAGNTDTKKRRTTQPDDEGSSEDKRAKKYEEAPAIVSSSTLQEDEKLALWLLQNS